ncbi:alpha,alpha-trehalase nth1 [Aspergillus fumigatus]|nr:alpha,alpha-trehalase nth1 [Aspergillus fumigatus]
MRTSRTSKETASFLQALSPPTRRQTRSSSRTNVLQRFAFNASANGQAETAPTTTGAQFQQSDGDDTSSLSSVDTVDIEDILEPPLKKRKSSPGSPSTKRTTRAPGRTITKREAVKVEPAKPKSRRVPARKIKARMKMRENNPTAPVDTMGCAELYWRSSSPRDKRFQTLIALMLSSQTKDTVTAVAMQRLHTELGNGRALAEDPIVKKEEQEDIDLKSSQPLKDSTLNLENILAVSPEKLNELIRTVGFHNNKTKYIKAAAEILRDQYNSDIPSTAEELMKLPGVGPKMAYLCMSAAWGKDEGIGVDVHVHRITNLWGWHKTKTPEETRMALESWLPRDKWHEINKLLVGLGQTVCLPVGRRCGECDLAGTKLCKSEVRGLLSKKNAGVKPKDEVLKDDGLASGGAKVKVEGR